MRTIKHNGRQFVLVEMEAWNALVSGGVDMPDLPAADKDGNLPAFEFARATIARRIIRERTAAGLSQAALARLAGIRPESLNQSTARKIETALKKAHRKTKLPKADAIFSGAMPRRSFVEVKRRKFSAARG